MKFFNSITTFVCFLCPILISLYFLRELFIFNLIDIDFATIVDNLFIFFKVSIKFTPILSPLLKLLRILICLFIISLSRIFLKFYLGINFFNFIIKRSGSSRPCSKYTARFSIKILYSSLDSVNGKFNPIEDFSFITFLFALLFTGFLLTRVLTAAVIITTATTSTILTSFACWLFYLLAKRTFRYTCKRTSARLNRTIGESSTRCKGCTTFLSVKYFSVLEYFLSLCGIKNTFIFTLIRYIKVGIIPLYVSIEIRLYLYVNHIFTISDYQ